MKTNYDLLLNAAKSIAEILFILEKLITKKKAYWLGLLAADGCIHENTLILQLEVNDYELIKIFLADIECNAPIHLITRKRDWGFLYPSGKVTSTTMARININDKILISDLKKWGIVERKTFILKFPKIETHLFRHFIRGYFDGDGNIYEDLRQRKTQINFSIASASPIFLSKIQEILIEYCNLKQTKFTKNKKVYEFRYGGNRQGLRIYNFLYKNSTVFLQRKQNKFKQILNQ